MRLIICLAFLWIVFPVFSQEQVVYGERKLNTPHKALYFDRNGFIYPDTLIPDTALLAQEAALLNYYKKHPSFSAVYLNQYKLSKTDNDSVYFQLNDSLLKYTIQGLRQATKSYTAVQFNIHGFRKSFHNNGVDVPSTVEYELLRKDRARFGDTSILMVDIYWDATYGCCFGLDFKKNDSLFVLFEKAMAQAEMVSHPIAQLIDAFPEKSIHILAHSLGTRVAVQSLNRSTNNSSDIRVGLIAAAIPRSLIVEGYQQNTLKSNIRWMVYYNEKDFALLKKDNKIGLLGPGAYKHGVTTLGCNKNRDAKKLIIDLSQYSPRIQLQLVNMNHIGKCHSLRCYTNGVDLNPIWEFFSLNE